MKVRKYKASVFFAMRLLLAEVLIIWGTLRVRPSQRFWGDEPRNALFDGAKVQINEE